MKKMLFHLHTKHSYDSCNNIKSIVDFAVKNDFNVLAITDHGTIRGSVEAKAYALKKQYDIEVIIGAEYKTTHGDIIALFIEKEIILTDVFEVFEEIKKQNGIIVIPHPTRNPKLTDKLFQMTDFIETFNGRSNSEQNRLAEGLSLQYGKPMIGGSDAHLIGELSNCYNVLESNIPLKQALSNIIIVKCGNANRNQVIISQIIKSLKRKDGLLFLRQFKSLISFNAISPIKRLFKVGTSVN